MSKHQLLSEHAHRRIGYDVFGSRDPQDGYCASGVLPRVLTCCAGKNLFVPKIDPALDDNKMRFLQIHGLDDLDALPRGIWGIREPEDKYNGVARRDGECFFLLLLGL